MEDPRKKLPMPAPNVRDLKGYSVPRAPAPTDLPLDRNEGEAPPPALLAELAALGPGLFNSYEKDRGLETRVAAMLGVAPNQVLATAGGDEAIDRAFRVYVQPDREVIVPTPTFEMLVSFARLSGAVVKRVPWPEGAFPVEATIAAATPRTGVIVVISQNNPTGAVATAEDLRRLSAAVPHALLLVDLAYGDFAVEDLLPVATQLPNALVILTLSKAWGLAGLRVGFAVGPHEIIDRVGVAGGPHPVSKLSRAFAERWLDVGRPRQQAFIARVREERVALADLLAALGAAPLPSQANFVYSRFRDALWVRDAAAGFGIALRLVTDKNGAVCGLRITCPGNDGDFARLENAMRTTLAPEALLFDMDGVLADVANSYRAAIAETARSFGVDLTPADIAAAKAADGANDDWLVTQRLLAARGARVGLAEATARFEDIYQGAPGRPGLREKETLIPDPALLRELAARLPLGVVTGRPRDDAMRFLRNAGVADLFRAVICREDAPLKPDPAPVRLALARLGVQRAWMIGDAPDDMRAARAAGALPLGFLPPGTPRPETTNWLHEAGAARVLDRLDQIKELLP